MKYRAVSVWLILFWQVTVTSGQRGGTFYREYWAVPDPNINNCRDRLRVNDPELSSHSEFGKRWEARANGLMLIRAEEDLFQLDSAELCLEMWGGHNPVRHSICV